MGCGTSMNTVVPLHYIENQNGSSLWNNKPGSDVLDYMTAEDMKQADIRAQQMTESPTSIQSITDNLSKDAKNQMICIRSFFKWISDNIRYDPKSDCTDAMRVLHTKKSSSEGHANLFQQMCRHKNITVIKITSFVKSYSFSLDYGHLYNMDNIHVWNAVLIDNTYHHVDCSWGALPINGKRISNGDIEDVEHFFFTSPEIIGEMC